MYIDGREFHFWEPLNEIKMLVSIFFHHIFADTFAVTIVKILCYYVYRKKGIPFVRTLLEIIIFVLLIV